MPPVWLAFISLLVFSCTLQNRGINSQTCTHTHARAHTHTCKGAASQLQTKRPQHIFLPSPLPSPVPASPARFLCNCSCFVFAPSALANPLDYVACLPFFRYFFIWFHFISFFFFRSVFAWLAHLRRFDMLPGSCPFFAALPLSLPLGHSTLSHTPCGAMVLACCLRLGLWLVPLPALPGPKPFGPVAKWAT